MTNVAGATPLGADLPPQATSYVSSVPGQGLSRGANDALGVEGRRDSGGLRPIRDPAAFNEAVAKFQNHVRTTYGYTMPYDQAAGLVRGDPAASSQISVQLPTMAFQDQQFRQQVSESGLTGLWKGEETLEAKRVRLQGEAQAETRRQFDLTLTQRQDEFAARLGLDRDVFMEGVRQFNAGRMDELRQWAAEHRLDLNRFQETVRQFNETTVLERERIGEGRRQFDLTYDRLVSEFGQKIQLDRDTFEQAVEEFRLGRQDRLEQIAFDNGITVRQLEETIRQFNTEMEQRTADRVEGARQFDATLEQRQQEHADNLDIKREEFAELQRQFDLGREDAAYQFGARLGLDRERLRTELENARLDRERRIDEFAQTMGLNRDQLREQIRQHDNDVALERDRLQAQLDIEGLRARNRIDEITLLDTFQQEAEDRKFLRDTFFRDYEADEAQKTRDWQTIQNALDWQFRERLQDDTQDFARREGDRQRANDNWTAFFSVIGDVGAQVVYNRYIRQGTPFGTKTAAQIQADMMLGRDTEAAWWKETYPELTDKQAQAHATAAAARKPAGTTDGAKTGGAGGPGAGGGGPLEPEPGQANADLGAEVGENATAAGGAASASAGPANTAGSAVTGSAAQSAGIDWTRLRSNFTAGNVLRGALSFAAGWQAGQGSMYGQWQQENPELAAGLEATGMALMWATNPASLGVYLAGRTAAAAWEFHGGGREKYWNNVGFLLPGGKWLDSVKPPELADRDDVASRASAFVNYKNGTVVWEVSGKTVATEKMEDFIGRTKVLPISFRGREKELWDDLSTQTKEELGFRPRYVLVFEDGVTFYNGNPFDGDTESKFIGRDDLEGSIPRGGTSDSTDAHGVGVAAGLLEQAVTANEGRIDRSQITAIADGIDSPDKRNRFLRRLANSEPFSELEVTWIFGRNPDGSYTYADAWDRFNRLDSDGRINRSRRQRDLGEE